MTPAQRILPWFVFFSIFFPVYAGALTSSSFEKPESMRVDPETGSYYVSNVKGDPLIKDSNGYISKITANGNTMIQKFIGGKPGSPLLNAPKGLWISGKKLFVTDIDSVKVFDKENGKWMATIDLVPWNAKFLDTLAMDSSGVLYVSDRLTNRIFKINAEKNYEVSVFVEDPALGGPSGLMVNPKTKQLVVVTWDNGEILEIDHNGKVHVLKRGLKRLSGIDYDVEGNVYVSRFERGEIYRVPFYGRGTLTTFMSGLTTPAGISCDRKKHELLVPSFNGNSVTTFPLILRLEKNKPDKPKNGKKYG